MKAVVVAFNQEKALVGAFSVITNLRMDLFQALEQELIIQSRMYETQQAAYLAPDPAHGGGYQNPVFDLEAAGGQGGSAGGGGPEPGWSRVTGRERRPKRWSFRRTNSGRFEHAGRVFPQTSPHSQR